MRNVARNVVEKLKKHILCSAIFSKKSCHIWDNAEKIWHSQTGHRWQYKTEHTFCMPDTLMQKRTGTHTHTHTHSILYLLFLHWLLPSGLVKHCAATFTKTVIVYSVSVSTIWPICTLKEHHKQMNCLLLYSFFWAIPRCLNFMCSHFWTLSVPTSKVE